MSCRVNSDVIVAMTAAFGADVAHGYNLVTSRTRDVTHDVSRVDRVRLVIFASRLQHKSANDVESGGTTQ